MIILVVLVVAGVSNLAVQLIGGVFVLIGAGLTSWFAAKASMKSADTTKEVGMATVEVDREDRFIKNLEARLDRMDAENADLRRQVAEAKAESHECKEKVLSLTHDVEQFKVRDRKNRTLIRQLRRYIVILRSAIKRIGQPIPAPPYGVDIEETEEDDTEDYS